MRWLGEMNQNLQELSKSLLGLHVKDVFKKNKEDLKLRELSGDEKEHIKKLYQELEQQVNEFVNKTKETNENTVQAKDEKPKKTRTTLRDKVRKKK